MARLRPDHQPGNTSCTYAAHGGPRCSRRPPADPETHIPGRAVRVRWQVRHRGLEL